MKRRDVLVDFLKNQPIGSWFSGNELSQKINVTDRSIRNYVKQINDETENLILIDKGYYQYNHEKDKEAISADAGDVKSRRFAILRKLLHSGYAGVNLFDLSEQFWVSESTIRGDILYLNNLSIAHHLKIHQQAFNYYIVGADSDKRNLMIESIKLASGRSDSFNEELQKIIRRHFFIGADRTCQVNIWKLSFLCQSIFYAKFHPTSSISDNSAKSGHGRRKNH